MNKEFKKKIAILSAILSVYSAQNSKPVSASDKNLIKGLAIGISSVLLVSLSIWGVVELAEYSKSKDNSQQRINNNGDEKNPIDGTEKDKAKKLDGTEKDEAKKLIDGFLNQEWIADSKPDACYCRCINYELSKTDSRLDNDSLDYKNYCYSKFGDKFCENVNDLNTKADFHLKKIADFWGNDRDSCDILRLASTHGNDLKILQFSVPEIYRVCFEFDIKRNKVLSLEYWRFRADDTVCHFCFKPKVGC